MKIYTVEQVRAMRPASSGNSLEPLFQMMLRTLETKIVPKPGPNAGFNTKHCPYAAAAIQTEGLITFSAAISPDEDGLLHEFASLVDIFRTREPSQGPLQNQKAMIVLLPAIGHPADYERIRLRILDEILAPAHLTAGAIQEIVTLSPTAMGFLGIIPFRHIIWQDKQLLCREDIKGETPLGRAFAEMYPVWIKYWRRHLPPRWPR